MPRNDPRERAAFLRVRRAENQFGVQLRKLAQHVADLMRGHADGTAGTAMRLQAMLKRYSEEMVPAWATRVTGRMLAEVALRDTKAWETFTRQMGFAMRREIQNAPTGDVLRQLQAEQVELIKSIPLQAAQRVHEMTMGGLAQGMRHEEIAKKIFALGDVTKSRATLIARTEVARASTNMTQARALYIGSEGYIWRTADDADVRRTHRRMEGKFIRWDSPPVVDDGVAPYHAGCFPNCRCYPEPVIPDRFE